MKTIGVALAVGCLLVAAPSVLAAAHFNEIYASHDGTDDVEFIELIGSGSLEDYTVIVLEGESAGWGTIDRVWDLTTQVFPGDGYFVMGDDLVANLDFSIGATNRIENGTGTFLLIENYAGWAIGTDIDTNNDGVVDPAYVNPGNIVDSIGMVNGGYPATEFVYYGAPVAGPDGSYFPAGIFRTYDYPNDWSENYLDFDDVANLDKPRTPGAPNVPEPSSLALLLLGGLALVRRR